MTKILKSILQLVNGCEMEATDSGYGLITTNFFKNGNKAGSIKPGIS
jgi:hypothetical protein